MKGHRDDPVWITGLGTVNALGGSVPEFWSAAVAGKSGMRALPEYPPAAGEPLWGAPANIPAGALGDSRGERFAAAAIAEALADAGLDRDAIPPSRRALALGVAAAGMAENEAYWREWQALSEPAARAGQAALGDMPNRNFSATADRLAARFAIEGPVQTFASSCSSSNLAIAFAASALAAGRCDVALAGGCEALSALTVYGFASLRLVVAGGPCRPFDARRTGIALGEGAGILLLERASSARARGAAPYAELAGCGASAEGLHMTAADTTGERVAATLARALADARLDPAAIDYVNAHGNGTPQNDLAECRGLRRTFGAHADRLAVSSTKSMVGHTLAACGGIEAVATLRTMSAGLVLPTLHLTSPDPQCDLDFVPLEPRQLEVRAALSASYAFGGTDCALVFALVPESRRERA